MNNKYWFNVEIKIAQEKHEVKYKIIDKNP